MPYIRMSDIRQGIVHIIGPEQGLTQLENPSFAATLTRLPTALSARLISVSAHRKPSMFWPLKRWP